MSTQQIACGRLVCDTNISSKELIRARSYDLTSKDEGKGREERTGGGGGEEGKGRRKGGEGRERRGERGRRGRGGKEGKRRGENGRGRRVVPLYVCDVPLSTALAHQVLKFTHPSVTQEEVVHAFG